jgi:hypothetical protein
MLARSSGATGRSTRHDRCFFSSHQSFLFATSLQGELGQSLPSFQRLGRSCCLKFISQFKYPEQEKNAEAITRKNRGVGKGQTRFAKLGSILACSRYLTYKCSHSWYSEFLRL